MTREENIRAILECNFSESKEELIDIAVKNIMALSQEQKSGKWILTIEDWNKWTCSKCGYVKRTDIHVNIGWKYCPNCGSAMKGE